MKFSKAVLLFVIPSFLVGCSSQETSYVPETLTIVEESIDLIIGSVRDLNDIVTLNFSPNYQYDRSVTWTTNETSVFTLTGSTITANKVGSGVVTATSALNPELSANVTINVYDPIHEKYSVTVEGEGFTCVGLENEYYEESEVTFTISVTEENKEVKEVLMNGTILTPNEDTYRFIMPSRNVKISVSLKKISTGADYVTSYSISYDLGTRKTAKAIESNEELFNTFVPTEEGDGILDSVSSFELMYGGANGGRSETAWYRGDILKIGSTSVNGYFAMTLNEVISKVRITGYAYATATKIQVGDASSTDWSEDTNDNKTTLYTCDGLTVASLETVSANQETTIEVSFEPTQELKIATTNKKPIFITGIEFVLEEQL